MSVPYKSRHSQDMIALDLEVRVANRIDKQYGKSIKDPHYSHQEISIVEYVAQNQRLPEKYDVVALDLVRSDGLIARNFLSPVARPWKITQKGAQALYRSLGKRYE
jgi:hypothetical protein